MATHIVKRKGHKEKFDEKKIYGSVYAACYVAHEDEKHCEKTAGAVSGAVKKWVSTKKMVTSHDIKGVAHKELKKRSKHAAFMYDTHLDVS